MGFSSGLPLALTFGTLSYWLAELGVSLTAIGLFGLVPGIPILGVETLPHESRWPGQARP